MEKYILIKWAKYYISKKKKNKGVVVVNPGYRGERDLKT